MFRNSSCNRWHSRAIPKSQWRKSFNGDFLFWKSIINADTYPFLIRNQKSSQISRGKPFWGSSSKRQPDWWSFDGGQPDLIKRSSPETWKPMTHYGPKFWVSMSCDSARPCWVGLCSLFVHKDPHQKSKKAKITGIHLLNSNSTNASARHGWLSLDRILISCWQATAQ